MGEARGARCKENDEDKKGGIMSNRAGWKPQRLLVSQMKIKENTTLKIMGQLGKET